jgi:hypothetical protein
VQANGFEQPESKGDADSNSESWTIQKAPPGKSMQAYPNIMPGQDFSGYR